MSLVVKESPGRGRGVFAGRDFEAGDLIEVCPVIPLPPEQNRPIHLTVLGRYSFRWPGGLAIVLGHGSLMNHSSTPNSEWKTDVDDNVMRFVATRVIAEGEEIMHDYGRKAYRPGTVDAPPWWSGFRPKRSHLIVGGTVVGLGIVRWWIRHDRGLSAVEG